MRVEQLQVLLQLVLLVRGLRVPIFGPSAGLFELEFSQPNLWLFHQSQCG